MIIDAHTHIGNSFWGQFSPEFLLDIIGDDVDIAICSNLEGIDSFTGKDEIECNLDMLNACKKFPKLKPLAVCEVDRTENADKIRKLLSEHPQFIGLKFHPEFTKLRADSDKYNDYLKVAQEYKKPCLYHSGHIRSRFSSPELIYKKQKSFRMFRLFSDICLQQQENAMKERLKLCLNQSKKRTQLCMRMFLGLRLRTSFCL